MDRLVTKIVAGGLSAGVFLFWWPNNVPGDGLEQLVIRGLLWTLTFELLVLAVGPAEDLVARRLRRRVVARRERVTTRLSGIPTPARTGGVVVLACCGIAGPVALLADEPRDLIRRGEPRVVKQVIVERPVIEKKVVVRRVVASSQPLAQAGAAPPVTTPPVRRPAPRRTAVAPERTQATKPATPPRKAAPAKTAPADASSPEPATPPAGDGSADAAPSAPPPAP